MPWVRADGTPLSEAEQDLTRSATDEEWALAEGLAGGFELISDPLPPAIAALLRLASGTDAAALLRAGLRHAFVPPDDSTHALARAERSPAFADLY